MAASHQRELAKAEPRSREQRPCVSVGGFRKRGRSLHRPGIGSELGCYLCPFSLMRVMRRSVTGSRLAAASSGFRLGVASSVSSATPALSQWPFVSAFPSNGCSRKDEDRSNDLPPPLLLPKHSENPDPVTLTDKIDVAIFIKPFLKGVPYGVLGPLSLGSQNCASRSTYPKPTR